MTYHLIPVSLPIPYVYVLFDLEFFPCQWNQIEFKRRLRCWITIICALAFMSWLTRPRAEQKRRTQSAGWVAATSPITFFIAVYERPMSTCPPDAGHRSSPLSRATQFIRHSSYMGCSSSVKILVL